MLDLIILGGVLRLCAVAVVFTDRTWGFVLATIGVAVEPSEKPLHDGHVDGGMIA